MDANAAERQHLIYYDIILKRATLADVLTAFCNRAVVDRWVCNLRVAQSRTSHFLRTGEKFQNARNFNTHFLWLSFS
jgi:hypothetical protein